MASSKGWVEFFEAEGEERVGDLKGAFKVVSKRNGNHGRYDCGMGRDAVTLLAGRKGWQVVLVG